MLPKGNTIPPSKGTSTSKSKMSTSAAAKDTILDGNLAISPSRGEFINYDIDTTYVRTFTIRNTSVQTQTIRFVAPGKPQTAFRLVNPSAARLAAGISRQVEVEFSTHDEQDYADSFSILNDQGDCVEIPLEAKSVPELLCPSVIDFGRVEHNRVGMQKTLCITNRGRKDAKVAVKCHAKSVVLHPTHVVAKALSDTPVAVELVALTPGTHTWPVTVQEEQQAAKEVTIRVDVVDGRSSLVDTSSGEEVVSVSFPVSYEGSKRNYNLEVVNGSTSSVSFAFQLTNDVPAKELPPFRFEPEQGRLGPLEKRPVTVVFEPPLSPVRVGWSSKPEERAPPLTKFEGLFSLLFVETEEVHRFHVSGEASPTAVHISPTVLDFGLCNTNDHRDVDMELFNYVQEIPMSYTFDYVAQCRVSKQKGIVPPGGSVVLTVTYQPNRMGKLSETLNVTFNNTVTRTIRLLGQASAATATATNAAATKAAKAASGSLRLPQDFVQPKHAPDQQRPSHSDAQRNVKASVPRSAPKEVDLGMVPAEGLSAPQPEVYGNIQREMKAGGALAKSSDAAVPVVDIKTAIKRRFEEEPTNAMERRDCRRELMPRDLLRVVCPVKDVEFGRVTNGATAVSSFFVYNGTNASVLITMPEEEMLTFTPAQQVVPSRRTAQFDVEIRGKSVQSLSQVIHFLVNQRHRMRFSVHAEIVPVEVTLSQTEIVLTLGGSAEEPVVMYPLTLTNRGNSSAAYKWHPQSKLPFYVEPSAGIIAPLSKTVAHVFFSPPAGALEVDSSIRLDVEGAAETKVLKVRGVVESTRCAWGQSSIALASPLREDIQVDLHRIAAGVSTTFTLTLSCTGANNAFFSFDALPSWLYVTPQNGRVCRGEVEELTATVRLDEAADISQVISCNVRGMSKPLKFQLSATVVAPPVTIIAPEKRKGEVHLDFGEIYARAESRQSVTMRNGGDVAGVVMLDLSRHGNFRVEATNGEVKCMPGGSMSVTGEAADFTPGSFYRVITDPGAETTVTIIYAPRLATTTAVRAYVPWRQIGVDSSHPLPPLLFMARALPPRLEMSTLQLTFPTTIVKQVPKSQSVTIKNVGVNAVKWTFSPTLADAKAHFLLEPRTGSLAPGATQAVSFTFIVDTVGTFSESFTLWADEDRTRPCCCITLEGAATKPNITPSTDMVTFPCVPLGVSVVKMFYILNEGYPAIDVIYKGEVADLIEVDFPEGHHLSTQKVKIPVQLTFHAGRPVNLVSTLVFQCSTGEQFRMGVCGVAINSILPTNSFTVENGLEIQAPSTSLDPAEFAPFQIVGLSGSIESSAETELSEYDKKQAENLRLWMNSNVLRAPMESFTGTLQSCRGEVLFDMLERITGKRPKRSALMEAVTAAAAAAASAATATGKAPASKKSARKGANGANSNSGGGNGGRGGGGGGGRGANESSNSNKQLDNLKSLVAFLKSSGCCVNDAQVPFMTPYEEYVQSVPDPAKRLDAQSYFATSTKVWLRTVLELLRTFYFANLKLSTVQHALPSSTDAYTAVWSSPTWVATLEASNVYSSAESLLLVWLRSVSLSYNEKTQLFPVKSLRLNSFDDLRDVRPFISVILSKIVPLRAWLKLNDSQVVPNPTSFQEHRVNAQTFLEMLQLLGYAALPSTESLLHFSQTDLALLSASLFFYLSKFSVKSTVLFDGKLLVPQSRSIEITNANSFFRIYRVFLGGGPFSTNHEEVVVPPNGSATLSLSTCPRYFREEEGWCLLADMSPVLPTERLPLLFALQSKPNTEPLKTIEIETQLYDTLSTSLQVACPFGHDCVVGMHVTQEYASDPDEYPEYAFAKRAGDAFLLNVDVLPLRKKDGASFPFTFAPLARGVYRMKLTFQDDTEGEFSYVVLGKCTKLKPTVEEKLEFHVEHGETFQMSLSVKPSNAAFEHTLRVHEEYARQNRRAKSTATTGVNLSGQTYTVLFVNNEGVGPNPFIDCAKNTIVLSDNGAGQNLDFVFKPKQIGDYAGFIRLTSATDIRLVPYSGHCVARGDRGVIHFACPARQTITQELVLSNPSDKDWLFACTVMGSGFSGPREFLVPRGKARGYPLQYCPPWVTKEEQKGSLELLNSTTGQKHLYDIQAKADAPLSEGLVEMECKTREANTIEFNVPSLAYGDGTYRMETDLPFAEGPPTLSFPKGVAMAKYALTVTPIVGGTYTGKVFFYAGERYVWFAVRLLVAPPEKEGSVTIRTNERTPVAADVELSNPLDKVLSFQVRHFGQGLSGPTTFEIAPGEKAQYTCLFTPQSAGESDGRLSFCNDETGEYWFEMKLIVDEAPPEPIEVKSALGVPSTVRVRLENRSASEEVISVANTNPSNFSIEPPQITIPPLSEVLVDICYTPSTVHEKQEALIIFSNARLGQWKYACHGMGLEPLPHDPLVCASEVGKAMSIQVPFHNVFDHQTNVELHVEGDPSFSVRGATTLSLAPGEEAAIDVVYRPSTVGVHHGCLTVRPKAKAYKAVAWKFPLEGKAHWSDPDTVLRFKCTARKQVQEVMKLRLPGRQKDETVEVQFQTVDGENERLNRAVLSSFASAVEGDGENEVCQVSFGFAPLRPFLVKGYLTLATARGASWRYRVQLEALAAPVDDTISLSSAVNCSSFVQFDLYNVFPYKSAFSAFFTADSSRDFSVYPTSGQLLPFAAGQRSASAPTVLQVGFKPSARLPGFEGTLVVETEEMQWSFKVTGKLDNKK